MDSPIQHHPFLEKLFHRVQQNPKHIVLSEGEDDRVIKAALYSSQHGLASITLLGSKEIINPKIGSQRGLKLPIQIVDPLHSIDSKKFSQALYTLRKHKGMNKSVAEIAIQHPLNYAAMMVNRNQADGTIGGAVYTTADTLRVALQLVGTKQKGSSTITSFFILIPGTENAPIQSPVLFADCALIVEPDSEQLAEIGLSSAHSVKSVLGLTPKVGFLSFSTAGSGKHPNVEKVCRAIEIARTKYPEWIIPLELQMDAAIDGALRKRKAPDLKFDGHPNVFVFPNLESGNIGYKIAERFGGMKAIGPVLQGLARPANDLSRGSKVDDIIALIAITSLQSGAN